MYLKGIKRTDIEFILECLYWNKYTFSQKNKDECRDKQGTLDKMSEIEKKLKEVIKHE